tara:strand:+ start:3953 stop:4978 length:1026 start_codon:yes stop_codon:yes gene_type:complete
MASFTVNNIETVNEYEIVKKSGDKSVLLFWTTWHEPSNEGGQINEVFKLLSRKYSTNLKFYKVDAESPDLIELIESLNVVMVPTVLCFSGDIIFGNVEGTTPLDISKLVKRFNEQPIQNLQNTTEQLNQKLKQLINTAPVMLFMKGSPDTPRCGFSRKIVDILKTNEIEFASFDILQDEDVRQGLKKYSDWPTYPQLYVKGELQGGLDIVQDYASSGNMKEALGIEHLPNQFNSVESLDSRIKLLINKAPIMLFMKGQPDAPQCGFSRTIVGILQENDITFDSFNILEDEAVRQRLKTYSDWPTYPQLYSNGELMGGLDIIKEMAAEGNLKDELLQNENNV